MTAREELAAVLEDYLALYALPANYVHTYTGERHRDVARRCAPLATDALLASPALASLIREKQAEALKEIAIKWQTGAWTTLTQPIKTHTGPARIIAAAQVVTDWLHNRAEHHCCDDTCTEEH